MILVGRPYVGDMKGSWYTPNWTSTSRRVAYPTFQGSGNVLGYTESSEETNEDDPEADAKRVVNFNDTDQIANIQVKLADGTNLMVKLNHYNKVSDLKMYIETARHLRINKYYNKIEII